MRALLAVALVVGLAPACGAKEPRSDVVARCEAALQHMREANPAERYQVYVEECMLVLVQEPKCRAALTQSLTADPSQRASMVAFACADAYCPRVSGAKPELCGRERSSINASELPALFAELQKKMRLLELGSVEAARFEKRLQELAPAPP